MTIIKTKQGLIDGLEKADCDIYLGVPFAKPPVNELRFLAPVPMDDWEGIRSCQHFAHGSFQPDRKEGEFYTKEFFWDEKYLVPYDEDCLYLNIWVPKQPSTKPYPVALWIHGGAFLGGYGSEMEFDGEAYAKRGVILVTLQYRLGALGFLAHPWIKERQESVGNNAILDQIAALTWVYKNIVSFGGDPENITVFGQSAGGMSTQVLVSSPLTKNMIKRAILQSSGGYQGGFNRDYSIEEAYQIGEQFVQLTGAKTFAELQALPLETIAKATEQLSSQGLPFIPVLDHVVLTDTYDHLIETNQIKDIDYMLGSCADDMGEHDPGAIKAHRTLHDACIQFSLIREERLNKPAYVYYFKRKLPGDDAGAFHSAELWYIFGTLKRSWRPFTLADEALSEDMLEAWTSFMKGEPMPDWRPYTKEDPFIKEFDIE